MKKSKDRLNHGLHNEKVCEHLRLHNKDFADWIITTAFYSALHFASYKIFPYKKELPKDQSLTISSIDEAVNNDNPHGVGKHQLMSDLLFKYSNAIASDYNWLKDMCFNARYVEYQQDMLIADRAITLMGKIKKDCVPAADIK